MKKLTLENRSNCPESYISYWCIDKMIRNQRVHCSQCSKVFTNDIYLRQHINLKHVVHVVEEEPQEPKKHKTQHYMTEQEYYAARAAIRNGENIILCRYCNHVPFTSKRFLFQHMTIKHSTDPRPSKKRKVNLVEEGSSPEANPADEEQPVAPVIKRVTGSWNTQNYSYSDNRKSYSNGFKASVIEEVDNGTSRRSLSIAYDIPIRTMEKWITSKHDVLLTCRTNVDVAGYTRIVRKTYGEKMYADSRRQNGEVDGEQEPHETVEQPLPIAPVAPPSPARPIEERSHTFEVEKAQDMYWDGKKKGKARGKKPDRQEVEVATEEVEVPTEMPQKSSRRGKSPRNAPQTSPKASQKSPRNASNATVEKKVEVAEVEEVHPLKSKANAKGKSKKSEPEVVVEVATKEVEEVEEVKPSKKGKANTKKTEPEKVVEVKKILTKDDLLPTPVRGRPKKAEVVKEKAVEEEVKAVVRGKVAKGGKTK